MHEQTNINSFLGQLRIIGKGKLTNGCERIVHLFEYDNKQSQLIKKVTHEIAKYTDTLGYLPEYMQTGLL
jgi:hypothetical protein